MKREVIYYHDELNDEFSTAKIKAKRIDGSYRYDGTFLRRPGRLFWYYVVAKPVAATFLKTKFHHRIENREVLPGTKEQGFFLYGNHTNQIADALIPAIISHPKGAYVVVHPDNVSMPLLGRITPSLGALPLPDDLDAQRNFVRSIRHHIQQRACITIYPEAHIWPYYTKIRPFPDSSFAYPVRFHTPVYCFTNTYQRWKDSEKIQIVTYVDGPFFPDEAAAAKIQRRQLRDMVYGTMVERSGNNNIEKIHYIRQ
ncbi:MAG: hypothetical protein IJ567_00515 [Lachnospiraceae bacterium]|nr:hypothetical protein [Lachnospiraceae bacterium]